MLFHAISLFMRLKGNRIKPRAYQAATTNGYRHESRKRLISSGVVTHFGIRRVKLLSSTSHGGECLALVQ
jgi:hypothetical protein